MKTILTFALFWTTPSLAENLYAPLVCDPSQAQLVVVNKSKKTQNFLIHSLKEDDFDIFGEEVQGQQTLQRPFLNYSNKGSFLHLYSEGNHLQFFQTCPDHKVVVFSKSTNPKKSWALNSSNHKLYFLNLFPKPQSFMLRYFDKHKTLIKEDSFVSGDYQKTFELNLEIPASATTVEVESLHRWSGVLFDNTKNTFAQPTSTLPNIAKVDPIHTYFLVDRTDSSDSFILALTDPQQIQEARDILSKSVSKIVVADIGVAAGNYNRSLTGTDRSPWSWEIKRFAGFGEIGSDYCQGNASRSETFIQYWLPQSHICFISYHLKKELSLQEVQQGFLNP